MAVVHDLKLLDDYSPADHTGKRLRLLLDDQSDVHIQVLSDDDGWSQTVRIAASGTRYSHEFREALRRFIQAAVKEAKFNRRHAIQDDSPPTP